MSPLCFVAGNKARRFGLRSSSAASIKIIYTNQRLHFPNFALKLKVLAMLIRFTGRVTTVVPVVGIIGVVAGPV